MKLLIGSKNPDKIAEIKEILADLPLKLLSAADISNLPDVIEDKDTIEDNARKKASEMAKNSGMYTLADDTGLFVESLGNMPGVYSARYAGENCSYRDNRKKLLKELQGSGLREACFKTVAALADPQGKILATVEGQIDGEITSKEIGDKGFGYDSIFYAYEVKKTFAEMTSEQKHQFSHRGRALRKMRDKLKKLIEDIQEV